jgi:hypothetical protein
MGVQCQEEVKPPVPEPKGTAGSGPNSKAINTLHLSHFPSILWQKNFAKVLILIDSVVGGSYQLPTSKHPRKPENPKKWLPLAHDGKNYFLGEQTEN